MHWLQYKAERSECVDVGWYIDIFQPSWRQEEEGAVWWWDGVYSWAVVGWAVTPLPPPTAHSRESLYFKPDTKSWVEISSLVTDSVKCPLSLLLYHCSLLLTLGSHRQASSNLSVSQSPHNISYQWPHTLMCHLSGLLSRLSVPGRCLRLSSLSPTGGWLGGGPALILLTISRMRSQHFHPSIKLYSLILLHPQLDPSSDIFMLTRLLGPPDTGRIRPEW